MADEKISAMPGAAALDGTEVAPLVQLGGNVKAALSAIRAYFMGAPGAIGGTTPAGGAFTTLSASGAVSGAGVTARLASPGPIGNTAPSTGAFTTLTTTGALTVGTGVLINSSVALTDGAGVGAGTITNAPAAGNPTKWIEINDNGTLRKIPAW